MNKHRDSGFILFQATVTSMRDFVLIGQTLTLEMILIGPFKVDEHQAH